MITDKRTKEPYINIWFGNFYRPAYDDKNFVKESIEFLKKSGFNSVMLDAKAWEDFRDRYAGGEASQYVAMQEYMQEELKRMGMSHEFLALYLNGDNLYPNIRFSPPIYGESVVDPDGYDGKWYRYWSDRAKDSMEEHVAGLMKIYGDNYVTIVYDGRERKPVCSMWDPIVAPSFDEEGRRRYLKWLSREYQGDIRLFNQAYGLDKVCFEELEKEDYWFGCRNGRNNAKAGENVMEPAAGGLAGENQENCGSRTFSEEDVRNGSPKARMLMDNRKWQRDELCLYFKDMKKRLYGVDPDFYLCPDMAQWGYFLNVDGAMLAGVGFADLWDTAARGIDIYRLAEYVDCAHFLSVPVTPAGDADAYVTSCHHSMMRSMNRGREFIGGIYWGRFLYNDIYAVLTPCEIVASIAAAGASGYTSYGMCGLDDGGLLHRMEGAFNDSLSLANAWAKQVLPRLGAKKQADIAILFPSAMALCETMYTQGNKERRLDLLGWYKACLDLGLEADVTDSVSLCEDRPAGNGNPGENAAAGEVLLDQYKLLIIPDNDCYGMNPEPEFEAVLRRWCERGGTVLYGPDSALAENCFGVKACGHRPDAIQYRETCGPQPDAIQYREAGMVRSREFCTYPGGKSIASWLSDSAPCVTRYQTGQGYQYAFGFSYGYAYDTKCIPHVPAEQKNHELYPLELMKGNILADILRDAAGIGTTYEKRIERGYFENGEIIINHTSYPYEVCEEGEKLYQQPVNETLLLPHSAVFVKYL